MVNIHLLNEWVPIQFKSESIEYVEGMNINNFKIAYVVFVHNYYNGDVKKTCEILDIKARWLFYLLAKAEKAGYQPIRRSE